MPGKVDKLRDLGEPELQARESELAEQVFRLRFQLTTGQAEAVIERLDVEALPGDAEAVERVANGRRIQLRGAPDVRVIHAWHHRPRTPVRPARSMDDLMKPDERMSAMNLLMTSSFARAPLETTKH